MEAREHIREALTRENTEIHADVIHRAIAVASATGRDATGDSDTQTCDSELRHNNLLCLFVPPWEFPRGFLRGIPRGNSLGKCPRPPPHAIHWGSPGASPKGSLGTPRVPLGGFPGESPWGICQGDPPCGILSGWGKF